MQKRKENKIPVTRTKTPLVIDTEVKDRWNYFGIILILVISFITFSPILYADFINLDDPQYVYENPLIKGFPLLQ